MRKKPTKSHIIDQAGANLRPELVSYVEACREILALRTAAQASMGMTDENSRKKGAKILLFAQVLGESLEGFIPALARSDEIEGVQISHQHLAKALNDIQARFKQIQTFATSFHGRISSLGEELALQAKTTIEIEALEAAGKKK
jgi:hypothetical protein